MKYFPFIHKKKEKEKPCYLELEIERPIISVEKKKEKKEERGVIIIDLIND